MEFKLAERNLEQESMAASKSRETRLDRAIESDEDLWLSSTICRGKKRS
jgi:hypothetical protein